MKNFIYFFKHNGFDAIKIGRTTGDSVNNRFDQMKTYSPFGCEIVGFFECENCVKKEREIHERFSSHRLHGEWFNISKEMALSIIDFEDKSKVKVKKMFNEWLSNENNNIHELTTLLKKASRSAANIPCIEDEIIEMYFSLPSEGDGTGMTCSEIVELIENRRGEKVSIRKIGCALKNMGFIPIHKKVKGKTSQVYMVVKNNVLNQSSLTHS